MAMNVAPFKLKGIAKDSVAPKNNVPYEKPQRKLTLKEMQARQYSFLDFDVSGIFDDLLEANLIDLPEMKRPEEAERKDDPKYCKYHRLVGHAIQDCFVFKDKVMQLARQGCINTTHGDDTEDTLLENEDSFDVDDCISTITFTDEDLLLGSKPHNRLLFIAGYVIGNSKPFTEAESHFADAKYYIKGDKKVKEASSSEEQKLCDNLKQPSTPSLKGFVPSTQEEEGGHEALAIDEEGFDPKAFKLLVKVGYNPKEKGHAIQDSQVGLSFTPPKPVRIVIKRVSSNYVVEGFSSTEDDKGKKNPRESVFNRLGPRRRALHRIANKQFVFDRLGPHKRMGYQKKGVFMVTTHSKKNAKSSPTQKIRSLIPSKMRSQTTLAISCGKVLKVKAQTMIFTQVQSDDEDDRESVASSNYISNGAEEDIAQTYHITLTEDGEIEEEDTEDAPIELEEGVKATIDELKENKANVDFDRS
ncbi:UNVERIFIED_CONTAM: hypothetical protein Sradi_5722000 [Sesamum radiatum]|uniref:G-patch domain-containing protein n=1 Tax=Sesamum radiatum TaxID=300843 RepID=A0AAW2L3K1_SESRA